MRKRYTYDFEDGAKKNRPSNELMGLAYILYQHDWVPRLPSWNYPCVVSPYWRLLHSTRKTARVSCADAILPLNDNRLILIPPDVEAEFSSAGESDMLYAHFLPILPVSLEPVVVFNAPVDMRITAAHRGLIDALTSAEPRPAACVALLIRALLDVCFAQLLAPYVGSDRRHPPPDPRVTHILAWMRKHYAEPLSNARIAREAGLEPDHAARLFRRTTGATLQTHLRKIRLSQATRLLADEDISIKQIAPACGFANRFHFTRAFTARFGVGPAAFRSLNAHGHAQTPRGSGSELDDAT